MHLTTILRCKIQQVCKKDKFLTPEVSGNTAEREIDRNLSFGGQQQVAKRGNPLLTLWKKIPVLRINVNKAEREKNMQNSVCNLQWTGLRWWKAVSQLHFRFKCFALNWNRCWDINMSYKILTCIKAAKNAAPDRLSNNIRLLCSSGVSLYECVSDTETVKNPFLSMSQTKSMPLTSEQLLLRLLWVPQRERHLNGSLHGKRPFGGSSERDLKINL